MPALNALQDALQLVQTNPQAAADKIDELIARLQELSSKVRAMAPRLEAGGQVEGGFGTKARMRVVGPDGAVKQDTVTVG